MDEAGAGQEGQEGQEHEYADEDIGWIRDRINL